MNLQFRCDPGLFDGVLGVCRRVREAGGTAYLVGGSIRDALRVRRVKDFDVEVFGLEAAALKTLLLADHEVDEVGESFGVLKLRGFPIDVSLPRRESKTSRGHCGFAIDTDPFMTVEEASQRRDFTINSMLYDPLAEVLLDPFGGCEDLSKSILRHTSDKFAEDPLRVLRGMQFVARYELEADTSTVALCARLDPRELAEERVFEEWKKLLLEGRKISTGLAFLRRVSWIEHYPELQALIDCPQEPEWHPEGDVWVHTLLVMDAFAEARLGDDWEDVIVGFACLCHDYGKPATTAFVDGRTRSRGHEAAGEEPTRSFLAGMTRHEALIEAVVPLVQHHLKPRQLYWAKAGDSAVRRLARKVGRIDRLTRVARADAGGRGPTSAEDDPSPGWLLAKAERLELANRVPEALVRGRHLIARGLSPGRHFGPLLESCFEAQLDGVFDNLEDGLAHLEGMLEDVRYSEPAS